MVRCKAHNLETENACPGSIPGAAREQIISTSTWLFLVNTKTYLNVIKS